MDLGAQRWMTRALHGDGVPADVLLACLLFAAEVMLISLAPAGVRPDSLTAALAWAAADVAAVAIRRWRPWYAVAFVTLLAPAALADRGDTQHTGFAVVVITYTAAAYLPVRQALAATALVWVPPITIAVAGRIEGWSALGFNSRYYPVFAAMTAAVCFFVGRTVYNRRAYVAALEDRARTAEASQRASTERAVAEERRRIARELHDVVAHHVSVMGVMATGSRRMLARDPTAADEALATIEQTGRTVLRELRRLLDVLRTDDTEAGDELTPQPGLAGIAGLVEQVREAGLQVEYTVDRQLDSLEPGVALTAYRIVQEALTNVLKHSSATTAEVRLTLSSCELQLEVADRGLGPRLDTAPAGHGLLGMRERVALYGGTLRTGPRPGGGFRVYAKIPLEAPDSTLNDPGRLDGRQTP